DLAPVAARRRLHIRIMDRRAGGRGLATRFLVAAGEGDERRGAGEKGGRFHQFLLLPCALSESAFFNSGSSCSHNVEPDTWPLMMERRRLVDAVVIGGLGDRKQPIK